MATKKQQRRRQKERRHEYEYVYVDEDGNELPYEPADDEQQEKAKPAAARGKTRQKGRPVREVKPPSWRRVVRRAILFAPLLFVALSLGKHAPAIATRLAIAVGYTALFVPMFFWIDRLAYRRYLRSKGGAPAASARKPKR
jgi:hypothetical protein